MRWRACCAMPSISRRPGAERMLLLILDDEVQFGRMLARIAQRAGWEVRNTTDAAAFQAAVRAAHPDAIMLDLHLGAADGIEQLRFLHDQRYDNPIVLMTGFADRILDAATELGRSLGLSIPTILNKPGSIAAVAAALDLVRHHRAGMPTGSKAPKTAARSDAALSAA